MGTYQSKFTGAEIDGLLEKVQTGGTKIVTLWEGELKTEGTTATLSDSVANYDFILVEASIIFENNRYAITTTLIDTSTIESITGNVFNIWNAVTTAHYYRITFGFSDNTTLSLGKATVNSSQWTSPQINKVIGIKY